MSLSITYFEFGCTLNHRALSGMASKVDGTSIVGKFTYRARTLHWAYYSELRSLNVFDSHAHFVLQWKDGKASVRTDGKIPNIFDFTSSVLPFVFLFPTNY